ncbi:acyl-CoA hydrolase [Knoellia sinensis KCTC 19936]|uniref:Acyl-CoA hydrolase n=1 Tax=Knoellia sinensis KCTC 19936 TaxID=1385520 RepID=A0A0A0J3Z4_9MICO|nr:acyl-CoA thioesterase [Knoellia sinensis]KGN31908.1 acyl-CoA hydrolase [Knoellia sinensis KCTC 19936]
MTTPSKTHVQMSRIMNATEANLLGNIHGGNLMKAVDDTAGVVANRYAGGPAVTAALDEMTFLTPVRVGDIVHTSAQLNWAGRSSMEVGVRVEVDRWDEITERVHVASAYLVFVAIGEDGKPKHVPPLDLETPEEKRRFREAEIRREHRLARRAAIEASREIEPSDKAVDA